MLRNVFFAQHRILMSAQPQWQWNVKFRRSYTTKCRDYVLTAHAATESQRSAEVKRGVLSDGIRNGLWKNELNSQNHAIADRVEYSHEHQDTLILESYQDSRDVAAITQTSSYRDLDNNTLLHILETSEIVDDVWNAYVQVSARDEQHSDGKTIISDKAFHHLVGLLATVRPFTHENFLRILSVLTGLKKAGGFIRLSEWNLLIDRAGKGWRRPTTDDYRVALGIFRDLLATRDASHPADRRLLEPDVITLTTLLNIAVKTSVPGVIEHAVALYNASGLPWKRMTYMALLPHYIKHNNLELIPKIVVAALSEGLEIDTLNGCIWAYAYHNKMQIALGLYDHLRNNVSADNLSPGSSVKRYSVMDKDSLPLCHMDGFIKQATMPPDEITYRSLIQALSYHGDLLTALSIFRDMISTINPKANGCLTFQPTMAVYRGLFLGFARNGPGHTHKSLRFFGSKNKPPFHLSLNKSPWSLENLDKIFGQFLNLKWSQNELDPRQPSDRMFWWIFQAYANVTNNDTVKMESVWYQLDARFKFSESTSKLSKRSREFIEQIKQGQDENMNDPWLSPTGPS